MSQSLGELLQYLNQTLMLSVKTLREIEDLIKSGKLFSTSD